MLQEIEIADCSFSIIPSPSLHPLFVTHQQFAMASAPLCMETVAREVASYIKARAAADALSTPHAKIMKHLETKFKTTHPSPAGLFGNLLTRGWDIATANGVLRKKSSKHKYIYTASDEHEENSDAKPSAAKSTVSKKRKHAAKVLVDSDSESDSDAEPLEKRARPTKTPSEAVYDYKGPIPPSMLKVLDAYESRSYSVSTSPADEQLTIRPKSMRPLRDDTSTFNGDTPQLRDTVHNGTLLGAILHILPSAKERADAMALVIDGLKHKTSNALINGAMFSPHNVYVSSVYHADKINETSPLDLWTIPGLFIDAIIRCEGPWLESTEKYAAVMADYVSMWDGNPYLCIPWADIYATFVRRIYAKQAVLALTLCSRGKAHDKEIDRVVSEVKKFASEYDYEAENFIATPVLSCSALSEESKSKNGRMLMFRFIITDKRTAKCTAESAASDAEPSSDDESDAESVTTDAEPLSDDEFDDDMEAAEADKVLADHARAHAVMESTREDLAESYVGCEAYFNYSRAHVKENGKWVIKKDERKMIHFKIDKVTPKDKINSNGFKRPSIRVRLSSEDYCAIMCPFSNCMCCTKESFTFTMSMNQVSTHFVYTLRAKGSPWPSINAWEHVWVKPPGSDQFVHIDKTPLRSI